MVWAVLCSCQLPAASPGWHDCMQCTTTVTFTALVLPAPPQRLSTSLYVSDLVTQFAKQLGVKALHYDSFEKVLAGELKQQVCTCCLVWPGCRCSCKGSMQQLRGCQECQLQCSCLTAPSLPLCCADATGKGERPAAGEELSASTLHTLYERLIEVGWEGCSVAHCMLMISHDTDSHACVDLATPARRCAHCPPQSR